ncbi:MAG: 50S ribosomal protein L11 methyltransferase [Clostridiales bacterium]|nr:50S ribosomal protein L11 methyltransferase [Clostridiales bacterium]
MKWIEFSVTTTQEASDAICEMLLMLGAGGVSVMDPTDMRNILDDPNSLAFSDDEFYDSLGTDVVIKAYFPSAENGVLTSGHNERIPSKRSGGLYAEICGTECSVREVEEQIISRISDISEFLPVGAADVSHEVVCEEDWADNWKKDYKSFRISDRITISPSWEVKRDKAEEGVVFLDPGSAFGTGTHESTAMCAEIMDRVIHPEDRVLDLGCGSGILSIIADKLGAKYVEAIDVDRTAVDVASENIRFNKAKVHAHVGILLNAHRNDYSLIVANIIADVLLDLCPVFPEYLSENGRLLISGIIDSKKETVLFEYRRRGFVLIEEIRKGDWYAFLIKKGQPTA